MNVHSFVSVPVFLMNVHSFVSVPVVLIVHTMLFLYLRS